MHSFENVSFEVDEIIDRALVMADEKQIRQACGNLIKNSYENIIMNNIQNGKICICFNVDKKFISISIIDNGTGIENSNISKILEPYYTTKQNGSGLGLAITKKIIDDHNGSMLVKSTKSVKGTVILMKFHLVAEIKKTKNKKNVKK